VPGIVRVFVTPPAERDPEDIWLAIAVNNEPAATRAHGVIGGRISSLEDHPRLGPRRPEIRPSARILVEGPYLILFETRPDSDDGPIDRIEIVRVIDGRRDLNARY
jgi:toxin ParE1/3/4